MSCAPKRLVRHSLLAGLLGGIAAFAPPIASAADLTTMEALGEALYFDQDLSATRTQSCATCHNPDFGFADPRDSGTPAGRAASVGADGKSLGDRNAPTAAYARFSPAFHVRDGKAVGG